MSKTLASLGAVLVVGLAAREASAIGALFSRPLRSTQTYQKMTIRTVDATVEIQDGIAITHVDQVFFNEMYQSVEAIWVFPLPEGAVVTELAYWFNGQRYVGSVRERQEAVRRYEEQIRRWLDPALLQYLGDNMFRLNIAPINPRSEVRFEINYVQLLDYQFGVTRYTFLLNAIGVSPAPLERVTVGITARTRTEFKFLRCPSYEGTTGLGIYRASPQEYTVLFGDENFLPDRDLVVEFETKRDAVDMPLYTYTPVPADSFGVDSFFALTITPPDSLAGAYTIPKRVALVADVSSSMEGERMDQLRQALRRMVDYLTGTDKFNIIAFGTSILTFQPDFVPATPENVAAAKDFIQRLSALGLTNMEATLRTALSLSFEPEAMNLILLATDGYPTYGVTDPNQILTMVRDLNVNDVRIFAFGIGDEVDQNLLRRLATDNHGVAFFIERVDQIAEVTYKAFVSMSTPVLMNLQFQIPGLVYYDVYPRNLPDLLYGSRITILGRYINEGSFTAKLRGDTPFGEQVLLAPVTFSAVPGEGVRAVAKLWARAKINDLLEQIALYGEQPELVQAVIRLSIQFQILTPYTAFYSEPTSVAGSREEGTFPESFALYQNYPNPFNARTEIRFVIPNGWEGKEVVLQVFDVHGRLVKTLYRGLAIPGEHRVVWDGTAEDGRPMPSGMYLCVLRVGEHRLERKMLLLR